MTGMKRSSSKIGTAAMIIIFAALLVSLAMAVIMNRNGSMSDETLTIVSSMLSLTLTLLVVVFAVLRLNKSNSEMYAELYLNNKKDLK